MSMFIYMNEQLEGLPLLSLALAMFLEHVAIIQLNSEIVKEN